MSLATDPKSIKIHKSTGAGVDIAWKDGHQTHLDFPFLRDACPCALCNEEREKSGRQPGEPAQPKPGSLPMFTPIARPTEVEPMGNYAVRFVWNDGHKHGVYTWTYFRELCQCAECKALRESTGGLEEDIAAHQTKKPN